MLVLVVKPLPGAGKCVCVLACECVREPVTCEVGADGVGWGNAIRPYVPSMVRWKAALLIAIHDFSLSLRRTYGIRTVHRGVQRKRERASERERENEREKERERERERGEERRGEERGGRGGKEI